MTSQRHRPMHPRWWTRALAWGLVAGVSAIVFFLYQRPEMLIQLSDQLWGCF
ncbi:hypothetical protein [Limnohabitans sp. DM1]|uniref:hypothetical protein n=1 Tax=Limnohabitans sp. DM1 TaxID=1597955 RepID=UPI001892C44D|nr:hypothetical protein [Limnohabitans sp. DM1]